MGRKLIETLWGILSNHLYSMCSKHYYRQALFIINYVMDVIWFGKLVMWIDVLQTFAFICFYTILYYLEGVVYTTVKMSDL